MYVEKIRGIEREEIWNIKKKILKSFLNIFLLFFFKYETYSELIS